MSVYFFLPKRRCSLASGKSGLRCFVCYRHLWFINEISGGVAFYQLDVDSAAVDGVAAISVVNYVMMMIYGVLLNIRYDLGAGVAKLWCQNADRVSAFLMTAVGSIWWCFVHYCTDYSQ